MKYAEAIAQELHATVEDLEFASSITTGDFSWADAIYFLSRIYCAKGFGAWAEVNQQGQLICYGFPGGIKDKSGRPLGEGLGSAKKS